MESGRIDWQIAPVDMKEVIQDALNATSHFIRENNINVTLNLPPTVPETKGDKDRLIQVMVNLISNAAKFCDNTNGQININLKVKKYHLQIDVQDNGIGISPDHQKIIFEKFRQVKDNSRGRPAGSGLGLTITKRIIDFHNGHIWVKSALGQGSVFSFTLPIHSPR
jgi:signal transduction histidine kinase